MRLRRRKNEIVSVTAFGYEIAPTVEEVRVWPATNFASAPATPETVTRSEPRPWGGATIESTVPPIASRPTCWIGTELEDLESA